MKINVFLIVGSALFLTSCSAKLTSSIQKTYAPLDYRQEVRVFVIGEEVPPNAEKLGTIKVGDSGFSTDCDYATVLGKAKTESRKVGGNALKITSHKTPDIWSTCHRITADVLKIDGEIKNTLLATNQIVTQQKDYSSASELPTNFTHKDIYPHFRVAIDRGWQYRTAQLADGMDAEWREHYRKMKSGFHFDVQAAYFFLENQGVELMFSRKSFEHGSHGYFTDADGNFVDSGELNEKIAFDYIGANYLLRLFDSKKKNCWLFSIGLGYMGYNDRLLFNNVEYTKITAATLGTNMTIGYDIGVSENFAIGFKLSLTGGSFRNYKLTTDGITTNEKMPEKTAEGLETIKLSVGLRFNK